MKTSLTEHNLAASAVLFANAYDAFATLRCLATGKFKEINPLMAWVLQMGVDHFVIVKILLTTLAVAFLWAWGFGEPLARKALLWLSAVYIPLSIVHIINMVLLYKGWL